MKNLFLLLYLFSATISLAETTQERVGALTRQYSNCLVVVRDDSSAGSAFIAHFGTRDFLFTNQHVVAGSVNPTFTLPDQTRIQVGSAAAAVDHDVMAYGLPARPGILEVMSGVDKNVSVGDEVAVLGNPSGGGVIHPLVGKIVGIGPNLVEISAEIVPGCSGSPVIHLASGKVIAIASYLVYEKADFAKGRMVDQVRRYCYRIDSIKKWEPVRWGDYQDEANTVSKVRRRTLEMSAVMLSSTSLRAINTGVLKDDEVRAALRKYQAAMDLTKTLGERVAVAQTFTKDLRTTATLDIEAARRRIGYDYFTKMLAIEEYERNPFPRVLEQILTALPKIEAALKERGGK